MNQNNFSKQLSIIVTGGSGFLGRHLIPALIKEGHKVKNIDLKPHPHQYPTVIKDVQDKQAMVEEVKDADVVFHLASLIEAGESVKNPQKFVDFNIDGTISVLEAMRINGIKNFLFSSSAAIYGEPIQVPIKEDDRTIPINPYGMTKLAMEGLLSSYVKAHGFAGAALRYFNLYGPQEHHQPETHAIPRFIKQIYNDEEVTVWGSGEHQRDYIFISDIVDAHIKALNYTMENKGQYHYFNLSTQRPKSVAEIVQLIENVMNKKAKIKHHPERPGDPLVLTADASKAKELLKWESQINIDDGLKRTVGYFMDLWKKEK